MERLLKQQDVSALIMKAISANVHSRVYYMLRPPVYGRFVNLADAEELLKKGFVRWIPERRLKQYEETTLPLKAIELTMMVQIKTISYVENREV